MSEILRFRVEKLIRDRLPGVMRKAGLTVFDRTLAPDEYQAALRQKLMEEAVEARDAETPAALLEELADVTEVILALAIAHGFSSSDIEAARLAKREAKGGFEDRVFNAAVAAPKGAPALDYYLARPAQYPPMLEAEVVP
jgi:predicted house-cleaning noncanonical NTP pyrophosphatase (MazG superfamily)